MQLFRTPVDIPPSSVKIDYSDSVMLMGSCFSESIGQKLFQFKFKTENNPFGIIYNPASIATGIRRLINNKEYCADDLIEHNNIWYSFDHHGRFSALNPSACLETINSRLLQASNFLNGARFLFLTFGTAWVYHLKSTGQIVANCHKFPASHFVRRRLSVDDTVTMYIPLIKELHRINPELQIVFTVSPVRHWKDGARENQLSKSVLHLAIDDLCQQFPFVSYFPSYEILMDELRDYRFYEDDMLHPSSVAVQYIWDCFANSFMDTNTLKIMNEVSSIVKASAHRPFNPLSDSHRKFVAEQMNRINDLSAKYQISFKEETEFFRKFL
jgi:hypothetical protein